MWSPIKLIYALTRLVFFKHDIFLFVLTFSLHSLILREQLARGNVIGILISNSDLSRHGRVPKSVRRILYKDSRPSESYKGFTPGVILVNGTSEKDPDAARLARLN